MYKFSHVRKNRELYRLWRKCGLSPLCLSAFQLFGFFPLHPSARRQADDLPGNEIAGQKIRIQPQNLLDIRSVSLRRLGIMSNEIESAQMAGVEAGQDFAIFQNYGYQGLYGGLGAKEIHARKGLKENEQILDHMGSTELAANLFRATQTDEKLRRDNIQGKEKANQPHYEVGRKVRQTIAELGGTMPEDLPTPEKSIRQIESEQKKRLKGNEQS